MHVSESEFRPGQAAFGIKLMHARKRDLDPNPHVALQSLHGVQLDHDGQVYKVMNSAICKSRLYSEVSLRTIDQKVGEWFKK